MKNQRIEAKCQRVHVYTHELHVRSTSCFLQYFAIFYYFYRSTKRIQKECRLFREIIFIHAREIIERF